MPYMHLCKTKPCKDAHGKSNPTSKRTRDSSDLSEARQWGMQACTQWGGSLPVVTPLALRLKNAHVLDNLQTSSQVMSRFGVQPAAEHMVHVDWPLRPTD